MVYKGWNSNKPGCDYCWTRGLEGFFFSGFSTFLHCDTLRWHVPRLLSATGNRQSFLTLDYATGTCVQVTGGRRRRPRCGGSETPLKAHSPPSPSPACAQHPLPHGCLVPPWAPTCSSPGSPSGHCSVQTQKRCLPSVGSHFPECRNPLEAPAGLRPTPKAVPGRRDALDSPGHLPELWRGRLSLEPPGMEGRGCT